ncbi:L,D-transpeptidase family protein [Corynebacterium capitovis]|uniref:L,D-transpeptidase n=1 Tax=Corynebacterium capitovis TaxID=131081 RepID=UPI00058B2F6E
MGMSIRRRLAAAATLLATGVALVACTIGEVGAGDAGTAAETTTVAAKPVVSVEDGATGVNPLEPVTVESDAGISELTMTNENGSEVEATLSEDGHSWATTEPLGYSRTYTLAGADRDGNSIDASFTTLTPDAQTSAYLGPLDGSTVGVAQAVTVRFSYPPTDRDAAEKAISVTTSNNTAGAFYWVDSSYLLWRPETYWEPGTTVTVKAAIYGKELGDGVYGEGDSEVSFTIGDAVVTRVDDSTKTLTVYRNGEVVNSFPVSMGRDGTYATPNGTYVVGDRYEDLVMDSRTYGLALDAGGYVTSVKSATQLSYSGIYVHSAPWATWALGSVNQSHGCINASPDDAAWFLNYSKRGDPVEVVNTSGGTLDGSDGLGYWNVPWDQWVAGNPYLD